MALGPRSFLSRLELVAMAEKCQVLSRTGLVLLPAMAKIFVFLSADDLLVTCGPLQDDVAHMKAFYSQCRTGIFASNVVSIRQSRTETLKNRTN